MLEIRTSHRTTEVASGDRCSFGRSAEVADLVISDDPRVHRRAGTIVAHDDGWSLHNDGRWLVLRISGLGRSGHVTVEPGQHIVVPWASARVEIMLVGEPIGFEVRLDDTPAVTRSSLAADAGDARTRMPAELSQRSGAFRALVALCEPVLTGRVDDTLPSNTEIAQRLNNSGVEPRHVTEKSVERRLDYCRKRINLKPADGAGSFFDDYRSSRRQLVDAAMSSGLVKASDLQRLATPSR